MPITCEYCIHWPSAKKNTSKQSQFIQKDCEFNPKDELINLDSQSCEYFRPNRYFRCDELGEQRDLVLCLHTRFNPSKLEAYNKCATCRQFDKSIKEILQKYFVALEPTKEPFRLRRRKKRPPKQNESKEDEPKLKRRRKKETPSEPKLKRRRRRSK